MSTTTSPEYDPGCSADYPQDSLASLQTRNLVSGYQSRVVVRDVSVDIPQGKITVLVGSNACGKSTLLKSMSRIVPAMSGATLLDGKAITEYNTKVLAQNLGILPQHPISPEGITVSDLVGRARHPYQGLFHSWTDSDSAIVAQALDDTGTAELSQRHVDELSGGQRQRVWIAFALAQRTRVLLLDEPTTFLDLTHQVEILDVLTRLNRQRGTTIVMVLHDINLAARYADHIVAMKDGRVVAQGDPCDVVTEGLIRDVFDLDSRVMNDPVSGTPLVIPVGQFHCSV